MVQRSEKSGKFKNLSFVVVIALGLLTIGYRINYSVLQEKPLQLTTWDALGYYYTLPGIFIYDDIERVEWFEEMEQKYQLSGGQNYQLMELENGNRAGKYFNGIAFLESPFFLIGHVYASNSKYPADGFSAPYQYSIAYGVVLYFILALFLLRRILLRYYDEPVVAISLLVIVLGTNLLQYVAIDGAMSHSFIFLLYVLLLHFTIKWHKNPKLLSAGMIGLTIGLAVWCRPTEGLMIFIPLLWGITDKDSRKKKWELIISNKTHLLTAMICGLLAILPQLLYWKSVTGSLVFDVGSKWTFLNPWFRVLFGFEKGWFIYTPLVISFIVGLFFMRKKIFGKAVIWFSVLNIYLIISWWDWEYGASYSTRALVQSYPVFALALCALIMHIKNSKLQMVLAALSVYLIFVNLFQIGQYNKGILSGTDMNANYYAAIYLNANPSPLDMSLLDTDELIPDKLLENEVMLDEISFDSVKCFPGEPKMLLDYSVQNTALGWFDIRAKIQALSGYSDSYLTAQLIQKDTTKETKIRLANPISEYQELNDYHFHFEAPRLEINDSFRLLIETETYFNGKVEKLEVGLVRD